MTAQPPCSVYLPTYTRFTAAVVTHKYAFSNIARVQFNLNCTLTYILYENLRKNTLQSDMMAIFSTVYR